MATSPRGPCPRGDERAIGLSERVYRLLLRAYPRELRDAYGEEMVRCFRDLCREALEGGGSGLLALWALTLAELFYTALKERSTTLGRNTYRPVAGVALVTGLILLIPLISGRITSEVSWSMFDFVAAGTLLFGTGLMFVLAARKVGNIAYRAAVGVALAAALLLVWINLAVGMIGTEDDPANLMYVGVLAVGLIGAVIARLRPHGMARAMFSTALAQALVAGNALVFGLGSPWSGQGEILVLNGFFVALYVGSGFLFGYAARKQTLAGAGQEG